MDYRDEMPEILRGFLSYHESIKGHSRKTIDEYYLDLRTFFRFIKQYRGLTRNDTDFDDIPISDVDIDLIAGVNLTEVYAYLSFLSRDRVNNQNARSGGRGISTASRARKIASIKSFYKYLTIKTKLLDENPLIGLDSPKVQKALPRYLSLEESKRLLSSVEGNNRERDYCILCIFLNCGLRISEIVGLNLSDVRRDHLRVLGKGNKERVVFLNDACADAINGYLLVRRGIAGIDKNALFVSSRRTRMSRQAVHKMVKQSLLRAGLDSSMYSSHKLRHTAATLMLKNGVDVRTLQELLGHDHLNTTQIYTHVESTELRIAADANPLGKFQPEKK